MEIFNISDMSENQKKYLKHYHRLVERSLVRDEIPAIVEKHHIIPKCMGGVDAENNLVTLSPAEHYVAHQLLVKIFPTNRKLIFAATMMIKGRKSNKHYSWLVELKRKAQSEEMKLRIANGWKGPTEGKFGPDNPNFGKKRTGEQRKRISESLKGDKHPMFGLRGENNPNFGKKLSEEHKAKLRGPKSEEHKIKLRKPKMPKTAERKEQLKSSYIRTEEQRKNLSNSLTGRKLSEEHKAKLRRPASEEARKKMSQSRKGTAFSPEHRQSLREAAARRRLAKLEV